MNEEQREVFFDLLTKKAIYGLDEAEQRELAEFDSEMTRVEFSTLELTAAAIGMAGISEIEPMPVHLRARIVDTASQDLASQEQPWQPNAKVYGAADIFAQKPARPVFSWLGWAAALAACVALAMNIWFTRFQQPPEEAKNPQPDAPRVLTPTEARDEMIRSSPGLIKANWAAGNVKDIKGVTGDVVWSDEKQAGYVRFRGLPVNDAKTTCYQLWIFDQTQKDGPPIDGGIFDVNAQGDIVVPITAKLKAVAPNMFALTIERHGGVVVSKKEKIAALAKVETQAS